MIKVERMDAWGFEHAVRGMRNPMNSWEKSDSDNGCGVGLCRECNIELRCSSAHKEYVLGDHDIDLMQRLYKAGTEHRKYLRQIMVSMDITAPLYWFKEFDTYKVGTVSNSCSTMHKIQAKEFVLDDFSHEHLLEPSINHLQETVEILNAVREMYVSYEKIIDDYMVEHPGEGIPKNIPTKKELWWQMIQLLPSSYNQRRTITMTYENVMNIINQREHHKLDEWQDFVRELRCLPYVMEIRHEKAEEDLP